MKRFLTTIALLMSAAAAFCADKPWSHGALTLTPDSMYFQHSDGTPFFYLADTGWLLPERLDRDEAAFYLERAARAGFNVVQVQTINGVPAFNTYGAMSHPDGWDFSNIDRQGTYGYWDHMDYIIDTAGRNGIYIGMVCIWGGLVKAGLMDVDQARAYGEFLAHRYKDRPNIIWIIGGDIPGDVKTEVWDTLARTIKANDPSHLMTFHPRGRHTSAQWFADREWMDFHMYQSGHRRYDQRKGDRNYPIPDGTEEDCWMYVDSTRVHSPRKPVVDGEPSYEAIPMGLHDADEPRWTDRDVRRYAYWDVFGGCAGHAYGHNAIMQFARPGTAGAYHLDTDSLPWWRALDSGGFNQMRHLKALMLAVPFTTGRPAQDLVSDNGTRHDRLAATAGDGYAMIYDHTGRPIHTTAGDGANVWWMDAATGNLTPLGFRKGNFTHTPDLAMADGVLILITPSAGYIPEGAKNIHEIKTH
ncbi:MAG: DUF4038 domain-containing protein [Muribaculaceae bacterium]|nr:DUF4038 domain-containing protein [Muribaculaceae bacterium]